MKQAKKDQNRLAIVKAKANKTLLSLNNNLMYITNQTGIDGERLLYSLLHFTRMQVLFDPDKTIFSEEGLNIMQTLGISDEYRVMHINFREGVLKKLGGISLEIPKQKNGSRARGTIYLFKQTRVYGDSKNIGFSREWNPDFLEFIKHPELNGGYTRHFLEILQTFRGKYSSTIYKMVKQQIQYLDSIGRNMPEILPFGMHKEELKPGEYKFRIPEEKILPMIQNTKYKEGETEKGKGRNRIKEGVLNPAQKEINEKSDIQILDIKKKKGTLTKKEDLEYIEDVYWITAKKKATFEEGEDEPVITLQGLIIAYLQSKGMEFKDTIAPITQFIQERKAHYTEEKRERANKTASNRLESLPREEDPEFGFQTRGGAIPFFSEYLNFDTIRHDRSTKEERDEAYIFFQSIYPNVIDAKKDNENLLKEAGKYLAGIEKLDSKNAEIKTQKQRLEEYKKKLFGVPLIKIEQEQIKRETTEDERKKEYAECFFGRNTARLDAKSFQIYKEKRKQFAFVEIRKAVEGYLNEYKGDPKFKGHNASRFLEELLEIYLNIQTQKEENKGLKPLKNAPEEEFNGIF